MLDGSYTNVRSFVDTSLAYLGHDVVKLPLMTFLFFSCIKDGVK